MLIEQIARALANLNKEDTISLTVQAILEGESPPKIVLHGFIEGLNEVAKRYKNNNLLYPDMFKASLIFNEALVNIKQQIVTLETEPGVKGAIGVVYGDIEDSGKNIVHMTLEINGFDVKDLGKSVPQEIFLQAAQEGADFIGISIMKDEGIEEAKKVVQGLKNAGLREKVKVIVGGIGVNAHQATEIIEADGYAEDAEEVVMFLKILFRVKKNM